MRTHVVLPALLLCLPSSTRAGTWGAGSFDNDDALDFAAELAAQDSTALVYRTLHGAEGAGYLEAPLGSAAIGAAEVVAALGGRTHANLPPRLKVWTSRMRQREKPPSAEQVALASQVVRRIHRGPGSELLELWREASGEAAERWEAAGADLLRRLDEVRKPLAPAVPL